MLSKVQGTMPGRLLGGASEALVWGVFGAGSGFLVLEMVGWVIDPVVVAVLWRLYRRSGRRWELLAVYAVGYLAVTAHYLLPDFGTTWPSAADRAYFLFLLLAGAGLLVTCLIKVLLAQRVKHRPSAAA
ncbi:MAG TPA: hypothetical protein VNF75_07300 [Candidatus Dormibacteraeota bacterium]|nr:hypothetical protein [Candidatus Dormibacteraeota bacterium]